MLNLYSLICTYNMHYLLCISILLKNNARNIVYLTTTYSYSSSVWFSLWFHLVGKSPNISHCYYCIFLDSTGTYSFRSINFFTNHFANYFASCTKFIILGFIFSNLSEMICLYFLLLPTHE